MRIVSWNVNGLRAVLKKEALGPVLDLGADCICFQETKLSDAFEVGEALEAYPYQFFHNAERKGYSGTGFLAKKEPLKVTVNMTPATNKKHPQEGRVITAEFDKFYLVNVYVPNSQRGLARLAYRDKEWDVDFKKYLKHLEKKKPVVVTGDFNVAHEEIDLTNPKSNRKNAGFTEEERGNFGKLLGAGFVDIFRERHPEEPGHYTWWSMRTNARERNIGWRLDYFLVSEGLLKKVKETAIHTEIFGSDHAPISLEL